MDVPFPADYGGVVDPFHKIRCLHAAGVKIHLHCFEYGRGARTELDMYCEEVKYYARREGHKGFSHKLPYIVCSRSSGELLEDLLRDDHPILLEGVHCSYLLNDPRFSGRRVFLRLHNVEYQYYRQLYYCERSLLKKMYYLHESNLLRQYEKKIADKAMILAMVEKDCQQYRQEFGAGNIKLLPVFTPFGEVMSKEGTGCFCLYHGNLSVAENEQAVSWLLKQVFHNLDLPLIVSGKNPSPRLTRMVEQHPHACLIPNPSDQEIQDLISKAQVNILPSFNCTGIKMKLLNALFNGRYSVVNRDAVEGTGLESNCHIADNTEQMIELIARLYTRPFTKEDIEERRSRLAGRYNNDTNTRQLMQIIWETPVNS
jgi:hypothetical protein